MNEATLEPAATVRADSPKIPLPRILLALIRRELWEHRALWVVPAILSVVIVLAALLPHFVIDTRGMHFDPFPWSANEQSIAPTDERRAGIAILTLWEWAMSIPLYVAVTVVIYFYLLQCLFDERKDRSILFWKSLPVSDGTTVASKLLVALGVVPLGVFLLAVLDHLLCTLIIDLRVAAGSVRGIPLIWDTVAWLKVEGFMLYLVVASILWYAPVATYLLLVSAWARRNVFLWAILPPTLIAIVERILFGTHYTTELFLKQLGGIGTIMGSTVQAPAVVTDGGIQVPYMPAAFDGIDVGALLSNSRLWAGLVVAAVFTYCAVRIRRYRDDT